MYRIRAFLFCLPLLALLDSSPLAAAEGAGTVEDLRQQIEETLAKNPNDQALQERGGRALEALEAWEAELARADHEGAPKVAGGSQLQDSQDNGNPAEAQAVDPPPNYLAGLDTWNIDENYVAVGAREVDWTMDRDRWPGTKASLIANYSFLRETDQPDQEDCDCARKPAPLRMTGTVGGEFLWGDDGLETATVSVGARAYQRNWMLENRTFAPIRDTLEWGVLSGGFDDHLGVDSYYELTVGRAIRTWGYRPASEAWMFTAGVGLSLGWAWADSVNPQYQDVSNPFAGSYVGFGLAHHKWGVLSVESRVVQGLTISNPSEGESTSREGLFRFAYLLDLPNCLTAAFTIEKRSFGFSNFNMDDSYEKSRLVGLHLGCAW